MLFLIIFILIIFIKFGLLAAIQSLIWIVVFLSSNFLSGINPDRIDFKVIRIMAILAIFMIIYINSITPTILSFSPISLFDIAKLGIIKTVGCRFFRTSFPLYGQLPYSLFSITRLVELPKYRHCGTVLLKGVFHEWDKENFTKFLTQLDDGKIYATTIDFIQDYTIYDDYNPYPKVLLSDPIVITKGSDPDIISKFVEGQLDKMEFIQTNFSTTNKNSVVLFLLTEIEIS